MPEPIAIKSRHEGIWLAILCMFTQQINKRHRESHLKYLSVVGDDIYNDIVKHSFPLI